MNMYLDSATLLTLDPRSLFCILLLFCLIVAIALALCYFFGRYRQLHIRLANSTSEALPSCWQESDQTGLLVNHEDGHPPCSAQTESNVQAGFHDAVASSSIQAAQPVLSPKLKSDPIGEISSSRTTLVRILNILERSDLDPETSPNYIRGRLKDLEYVAFSACLLLAKKINGARQTSVASGEEVVRPITASSGTG